MYRSGRPEKQEGWAARPITEKPVFQPQYIAGNRTIDAINAIIEIRAIWKYVIEEALHNYPLVYSKLTIPISAEVVRDCRKHKEKFAVYDITSKSWLIEPSESPYKFCYNGQDFEDFTQAKTKINGNRLLLVGKYTKMKQEPNLLTATAAAPLSYASFVMPTTRLTVGVPGCGKTRFILNEHTRRRIGTNLSRKSIILTSCTEGAEDIRSRAAKKFGGRPDYYRRCCRTIDSYLLNSREWSPNIWVDEALMEHPGKLFLVSLFSRCRCLSLLGDPNQLGYINRLNDVTLRFDKSALFFQPVETLNISYRCPVDVMAILSNHYEYKGGAHSASNVLRSLTCKTFTSLEDVPKLAGTKYLVFEQAEKKQMKDAGYDVSSVHEFQGKEANRVVLVRTSRHRRQNQIYESPPHMLVALSRHRESLVYYTPVRDKLKNLMDTSLTAEELHSHQYTIRLWKRLLAFLEFYYVVMSWIYSFMDLFQKERNTFVEWEC